MEATQQSSLAIFPTEADSKESGGKSISVIGDEIEIARCNGAARVEFHHRAADEDRQRLSPRLHDAARLGDLLQCGDELGAVRLRCLAHIADGRMNRRNCSRILQASVPKKHVQNLRLCRQTAGSRPDGGWNHPMGPENSNRQPPMCTALHAERRPTVSMTSMAIGSRKTRMKTRSLTSSPPTPTARIPARRSPSPRFSSARPMPSAASARRCAGRTVPPSPRRRRWCRN